MEKLGQLAARSEWDLIVVDTPPSRSALDFLDAPKRLGRFLDGRMIRLLTAPARAGGKAYLKVVTVELSASVARVFTKILGGELLARPVSAFVSRARDDVRRLPRARRAHLRAAQGARHGVRGRRRARAGRAARGVLLRRAAVGRAHAAGRAGRQPGARRRIASAGRGQLTGRPRRGRRRPAHRPASRPGPATALAEAALRVHAELATAAEHDARMTRRFAAAHPACRWSRCRPCPTDVHDLDGLRQIGDLLASAEAAPSAGWSTASAPYSDSPWHGSGSRSQSGASTIAKLIGIAGRHRPAGRRGAPSVRRRPRPGGQARGATSSSTSPAICRDPAAAEDAPCTRATARR